MFVDGEEHHKVILADGAVLFQSKSEKHLLISMMVNGKQKWMSQTIFVASKFKLLLTRLEPTRVVGRVRAVRAVR